MSKKKNVKQSNIKSNITEVQVPDVKERTSASGITEVRVSEVKERISWLEENFSKCEIDQIKVSIVMISMSSITSLILKGLYIVQESGFDPEYFISQLYPFIIGSLPAVIGFFKFVFNLLNIAEIPMYTWKLVKYIRNKK